MDENKHKLEEPPLASDAAERLSLALGKKLEHAAVGPYLRHKLAGLSSSALPGRPCALDSRHVPQMVECISLLRIGLGHVTSFGPEGTNTSSISHRCAAGAWPLQQQPLHPPLAPLV